MSCVTKKKVGFLSSDFLKLVNGHKSLQNSGLIRSAQLLREGFSGIRSRWHARLRQGDLVTGHIPVLGADGVEILPHTERRCAPGRLF
jgi:hypothetical protein